MANVYVRSAAAGAGTGADWTNAFTTLSAALAAKAAGDDFWVSEDHAESTAGAVTLTAPGTAASPNRIICVNHSGSVPPVSADLRATATVSTTGNNGITFGGFAYCRGVTFVAGNSTGTASYAFAATALWWQFDTCAIQIGSTGTGGRMALGCAGSVDGLVELVNTTVQFANASQLMALRGLVRWRNTPSAVTGATVPTTMFQSTGSLVPGSLACQGVDLSALGSGKNLINVALSESYSFLLTDCKLGSSVSVTTGNVTSQGGVDVRMVNCDSSDTNYRYYRQTYQGTIQQETTIVLSGGASDGTTPISRKMVTTANSKPYSPLESDWMVVWNESTGSALTATIEVVTDNVTLKDSECWVEVEHLGTSSFPLGNFASDRAADVLAAGANQTSSSVTWTTTGLATPVKQKLVATFTPAKKGPVRVRVCLAKASATVYFDPKPTIA